MSGRGASRAAVAVAVVTLVVGAVGFIVAIVLNAFVLDKYNAYGEVPIPGTGTVELPAGEVTVSFHTIDTSQSDGGYPIPEISVSIDPPAGVETPAFTESIGGTTSVMHNTWVRLWTVDIEHAGRYRISTDGEIAGYIRPRLAFGHGSAYGWVVWLFGGLTAAGVVWLVVAWLWSVRAGKAARPLAPHELITDDPIPDDRGIRLEQLRQLAALRDSGALTEEEFQAEKRRILRG
ncbi:SHOCT domain-containing protein [Mycolicibacterium phlei]